MSLSPEQFREIHSRLGSEGGFTVNPKSGARVTKGISVAPAGNERQLSAATSSGADVAAYHAENQGRFAKGASLGGWRHEGTDYLDTPTVYPNTPGGVSRSRRQMLASNQIASFNLSDFSESFNPYHAENRRGDIVSSGGHEEAQIWAEMPRRVGRVNKTPPIQKLGQSFS